MPTKEQGEEAFQTAMLAAKFRKGMTMTAPTQAQIEALRSENKLLRKIADEAGGLIDSIISHGTHDNWKATASAIRAFNELHTAAAEVGEFPEPSVEQIEARWERKFKDAVQNIQNKAIERCACWLNEEAKSLRSMVSGGDGSEKQWIEADALDRASVQLRTLKG